MSEPPRLDFYRQIADVADTMAKPLRMFAAGLLEP
jgi:hypothetical protein